MNKNIKKLMIGMLVLGAYFANAIFALAAVPSIESVSASPSVNEATLNGLINPNGYATTAWYEYGTSATLSNFNETIHSYVGSTIYSFPYERTLEKLLPETTYYYRLATNNGQGTEKSNILQFTTKKATDVVTTVTETPTFISNEMLEITTTADSVENGSEITYLVVFRNTTLKNLVNAKIIVELPKEVTFKESNFGVEEAPGIVVFNADILVPLQVSSITIRGNVNKQTVVDKDTLIATAVMSYDTANTVGKLESKEKVAYIVNHTNTNDKDLITGLEANPFIGSGFLPKTLIGWLVIVLLVLGLVLVTRSIYMKVPIKAKSTTKPQKTT